MAVLDEKADAMRAEVQAIKRETHIASAALDSSVIERFKERGQAAEVELSDSGNDWT